MDFTDGLGWAASIILLATLVQQVRVQWSERSTAGVSGWLFVGQLVASAGFLGYAWLLDSMVLVFTNAALLVTAIIGQMVYRRNRRLEKTTSVPVGS